jgi:hypothetical protein
MSDENIGADPVASGSASPEQAEAVAAQAAAEWTPVQPFAAVPATTAEPGAPATRVRRLLLTGAEQFWYVLQCIAFGAGYLVKVPTKKALSEAGLTELTGAEKFWYVLQCIAFGAGYFTKVPVKKALSEAELVQRTDAEQFWYVLQCIAFGAGYFTKVPVRKALTDASLTQMTDAAQFWYVVQCIGFGAGYFAKVPQKKALSELAALPGAYTGGSRSE